MSILVHDNVGVDVIIDREGVGCYTITINKGSKETPIKNKISVGDVKVGESIQISDHEYIVLCQGRDASILISKTPIASMRFGDTGEYGGSFVRKYLTGRFYKRLAKEVGEGNIFSLDLDLEAVDGTGKNKRCSDKVAILSNYLYRKYVDLLPIGYSGWTSTPFSYDHNKNAYLTHCYVDNEGCLDRRNVSSERDVYPFFALNPSTKVYCKG